MKIPAYLLASLSIPLVLAFASVADELAFHPKKDLESKKTLAVEAEFRVEEFSFTVNGEPMPQEGMEQLTSQAMLLTMGIDATETFVATKDGAPTDLRRTYDSIDTRFEFGDEVQEQGDTPDLEGKTVRFLWDEKTSEFQKSYHESQGDDAALEGLVDDMEVRALLPGKKVAAGDTWEVTGEKLAGLFMPGGFPGSDDGSEDGPDLAEVEEQITKQLEESFREFKVVCTYKGAREADGVQVGEVTFTYEGKASLDLGDIMRSVAESMGGEGMPQVDISATASMDLTGEGVLLWDIAAGGLHSYEMKAKVGFDVNIEVSGDEGGQSFEVAITGSMGGDVTWDMKRQ